MAKVIILVAYTTAHLEEHAHQLQENGHEVIPMLGNSDVLRHRDQFAHAEVVVVGESEDANVRQKFATWLKQNFPNVRLVAIGAEVAGADAVVESEGLVRAVESSSS